MVTKQKKISIFLDTNIFQTFFGSKNDKKVFLYKAGVTNDYYRLRDFINEYQLSDQIEICIPSVVIMECKQHMLDCFIRNEKKLIEDVTNYKKIFGSLIEIDYSLKIIKEEYSVYIDKIFDDFVTEYRNQCKVVRYDKRENLIDILLSKALAGTKPFVVETIGGKPHSDAGFKDSVIAETIYSYCEENKRMGILITNDGDFGNVFNRQLNNTCKYVQFSSIDKAIEALSEFYGTDPVKRLNYEFSNNTYWHEFLLHEAGLELDDSVTERVVTDVFSEDENVFDIKIDFTINETKYHFLVKFDSIANDIIECSYKIEND